MGKLLRRITKVSFAAALVVLWMAVLVGWLGSQWQNDAFDCVHVTTRANAAKLPMALDNYWVLRIVSGDGGVGIGLVHKIERTTLSQIPTRQWFTSTSSYPSAAAWLDQSALWTRNKPFPRPPKPGTQTFDAQTQAEPWDYKIGSSWSAMVVFPYWLPAGIFTLLVILVAWRAWRTYQLGKRKPGHCLECGYDLRATPDRCPECGAVPTDAVAADLLKAG